MVNELGLGDRSHVVLNRTPVVTSAEARVLELVAEGLSTREIACRLQVSTQAVTYHIGNLLGRFCCVNRAGLVARAFFSGCFDSGPWPPVVRKDIRLPD